MNSQNEPLHTWQLNTEAETVALAKAIAPLLVAGDVLKLVGDLGAGKTTFSRALIQALGTNATHIPSPTYTLIQQYDDTRLPVWHLDAYRLEDPSELLALGLEEALHYGVLVAEWPPMELQHQRAESGTLHLSFTAQEQEGVRELIVTATGSWPERLKKLAW